MAEARKIVPSDGAPDKKIIEKFVSDQVGVTTTVLKANIIDEITEVLISLLGPRGRDDGEECSRSSSTASSTTSSAPSAPAAADHEQQQIHEAVPPPPEKYVANRLTGVYHCIAVGPPTLDAKLWATACGWRFGCFATAMAWETEHSMCQKCARLVAAGASFV